MIRVVKLQEIYKICGEGCQRTKERKELIVNFCFSFSTDKHDLEYENDFFFFFSV